VDTSPFQTSEGEESFTIKWIGFDLDDTLFNGTLLVEKAREASIRMMIEYGLPIKVEDGIALYNEIVEEFGSNSESHLDNLMNRLQNSPKYHLDKSFNINKYVAAGIIGYHREKVQHFKPFKDVIKSLQKIRDLGIKTAIITDGTPKKQYEKILRLKLEEFFDEIIITDEIAIRKPNPLLFSEFLEKIQCAPQEVMYVGDRIDKDIVPAKQVGIIAVAIHRGTKYDSFITKQQFSMKPDYNINSLYELLPIIEKYNEK
jgi:putative hydrolase of the HAD superfamily